MTRGRFKAFCLAAAMSVFSALICQTARAFIGPELSRDISGYRIVLRDFNWKGEDGVIFQVYKGPTKILERRAHSIFLFDVDKQGESYAVKDNASIKCADLTGDGAVDLIVQEWSGGAYGCYKYDIYSLAKNFKHIWHHDAVYGHLRLEFPAQGRAQLIVEDSTFCNFKSVGQGSGAKPSIYLTWRNGFAVERAATIAAAKTAAGLDLDVESDSDIESTEGSRRFVDLIYSGQTSKALALLDGMQVEQRRDYLRSFFATFKKSPFYFEIIAFNEREVIAKMQKLVQ